MSTTITKGSRVRAEVFTANPIGTYSIAGVQPKVTATSRVIVGVVKDIRGDHPTNPTKVQVVIQPDDGSAEVTVSPNAIFAVDG